LVVDKHSFVFFFVFSLYSLLFWWRTEQKESLSTTTDGIVHDSASSLFPLVGSWREREEAADHDGWNRTTFRMLVDKHSFIFFVFSSLSGGK